MSLYRFHCRCGCEHIGETCRQLCQRIKEDILVWYTHEELKEIIPSSITQHIVGSKIVLLINIQLLLFYTMFPIILINL